MIDHLTNYHHQQHLIINYFENYNIQNADIINY